MVTRKEMYAQNRRHRKELGIVRKKCKGCGCYTEGRHKVWCKSNKTILFGLQLRREELKKLLKKAETKFRNTQDLSDKETIADCKRLDILNELSDIEDQIKDYGGDLDD